MRKLSQITTAALAALLWLSVIVGLFIAIWGPYELSGKVYGTVTVLAILAIATTVIATVIIDLFDNAEESRNRRDKIDWLEQQNENLRDRIAKLERRPRIDIIGSTPQDRPRPDVYAVKADGMLD